MTRNVEAVGERVRAFYEQDPFPDYEDLDTPQALLDKARAGEYARMLDDNLPLGIRVLDAGCGTGQISSFLSLTHRTVIGVDFSHASLQRGQEFKDRFNLADVRFVQMDLFRPALRPASFDFIMSNGVLHHTADPEGAFRGLCDLLKPGGHILIGLYNPYGRLLNNVRKVFYRLTGRKLEGMMWPRRMTGRKQRAWFLDQYEHPHELTISVDEVLGWFLRAGIDYIGSVPHIVPGRPPIEKLFDPCDAGGRLAHVVAQLTWITSLSSEGGYFVTIGRKRA